MTRRYSLVIEGDETGYTAHVPELPTILVAGRSIGELTDRAQEAIRVFRGSLQAEASPAALLTEIEVDLPA